ncbi:MAG: glycosyltransferase family 4 protein [Candidatus Hodarchaeota archaeon]
MNILRLSTRIYPDIGGPAKQVFFLSEFLSKHNIKSFNIAFLPKKKKFVKIEEKNPSFKIYYIHFHAPGFNAGILNLLISFVIFIFFGFIKSMKILGKHKIDIIHAHSPLPTGFLAFMLNRIFKIPFFYSIHGLDIPLKWMLDLDIKISSRNSIRTFLVSKEIESYLKNNYNLKNLQTIPNFVDVSKFFHNNDENEKRFLIKKLKLEKVIEKDDFIILYIGYMIFRQKVEGMIDFLEAFNHFLKKIPNNKVKRKIKLLYVGDGKYANLLTNRIDFLNLNKNVFLLGKRDNIKDILAVSDLFALTSYIEGFPNVILEAMASKLPCIGTDVGDIKYLIGNTGYLVKPGDIDNIEKKINTYYMLSESEQSRMMKAAYNRAKNLFDIEKIGKKFVDIYYT